MTEKLSNEFYRIAWEMPGYGKGHGEWHEEDSLDILQGHVDDQNQKNGKGTHRIEKGDGSEALEIAQQAIKKASSNSHIP